MSLGHPRAARSVAALLGVARVAAGDASPRPTGGPSQGASNPSEPAATPAASLPPGETPAPTQPPGPVDVPLAVVTGITNLKATITVAQLTELAGEGKLVVPCGVDVLEPELADDAACTAADQIVGVIRDDQEAVALLPPGLVEPATRVLPFAGDGPYGLFGPDLFGDPEARALPYPVKGRTTGEPVLAAAWTHYDPAEVWTLTNIGSLCSDRAAAKEAVTAGKGWHWVFNGGTARYRGEPSLNPNPPPGIDRNLIVRPVETGSDGVVAAIQSRADVAIADHECPILPDDTWKPVRPGAGLSFAVPEAVVPEWTDTLGLDFVYLAANHMSDRGVAGIRSTLRILDKHELARTGLGMNLDEAIAPAYLQVAGLKVGFVAWNDVGGVARADADTAGVPWITKANVNRAVQEARDGGADLVICDPQWWGGREYHDELLAKQVKQLGWFDGAGCDHVIGSGTHVAGPVDLRVVNGKVRLTLVCPGNYVFGQDFFQNLQEGVIYEQKFVGKTAVNFRLHPYVIILGARPALIDPETDGRYVLQRIWKNSELDYGA
jgi:hypothetical protein